MHDVLIAPLILDKVSVQRNCIFRTALYTILVSPKLHVLRFHVCSDLDDPRRRGGQEVASIVRIDGRLPRVLAWVIWPHGIDGRRHCSPRVAIRRGGVAGLADDLTRRRDELGFVKLKVTRGVANEGRRRLIPSIPDSVRNRIAARAFVGWDGSLRIGADRFDVDDLMSDLYRNKTLGQARNRGVADKGLTGKGNKSRSQAGSVSVKHFFSSGTRMHGR